MSGTPKESTQREAAQGSEVTTSVGLGVLHLFCKIRPDDARPDVHGAVQKAVAETEDEHHQVLAAAILGHKADLAFMALGPDIWRLRSLQTGLQASGLEVCDSYVSMTEVSEYASELPEEMLQARLYPQLPPEGKRAFCFYPMSKRREVVGNWYGLPFEERRELMYEHGKSGRKFRGRIVQLITGSTGVDDYEWGVTLFGEHLDDLKDVVYTMRYDEASATYADFGRFYTGLLSDDLQTTLDRVGL